jgi:hypothetical protein
METTPVIQKHELPKIADLYKEDMLSGAAKDNALLLLVNCEPPSTWIQEHPVAKTPYIPIGKIEFLLTKIFGKWWVEIKDTKLIANSVAVTVRLFYTNPINGETEWQDGIGAQPLQTDKGFGATDFNAIKSAAVSMALPSAESYAIKDAAEKIGKIFGKDIARKGTMDYEKMVVDNIQNIADRAAKVLEDDTTRDTQ